MVPLVSPVIRRPIIAVDPAATDAVNKCNGVLRSTYRSSPEVVVNSCNVSAHILTTDCSPFRVLPNLGA